MNIHEHTCILAMHQPAILKGIMI